MEKILHVQAGDWPAIQSSEKPVLVDFWAEWCSPCRMLAPTFEKLAEKYGDQIEFAKVNVDEVPELANHFAVRSIPTLVLLRDGVVVEQLVAPDPTRNWPAFWSGTLRSQLEGEFSPGISSLSRFAGRQPRCARCRIRAVTGGRGELRTPEGGGGGAYAPGRALRTLGVLAKNPLGALM